MIVLEGVRFAHEPEGPEALRGVDLAIADGERVALLGRNGSGKSTLARLLNGLHVATAGTVRVDGLDPGKPDQLSTVRRRVQMVFQTPENQQVGTTVFDDIAFGLANFAVPTAEMSARARAALVEVGLDVELTRNVNQLSGGELQRLALASVTALRPRHLVLDEVTSMLDPRSRAQVLSTVERLRQQSGMTVVQITHHLDEIEGADRAVVLQTGRVVREGTVEEVLADADLLQECGLEAPYRWRRPRSTPEAPGSVDTERLPFLKAVGVGHAYASHGRNSRARRRAVLAADPVLDGVDLTVSPGELVAVAGRSGAGKSTLISILKGLVEPLRGVVEVGGQDPWSTRRPELFDPIGYVFQHPEHQLFAASVRADVAFGLRAAGPTGDEVARRVDEQLRRLGLDPDEVGDRNPFELSGGQQRRVAFAGVLVTDPQVLVLDEPTAGLDAPSRDALFKILHDARARGLCVLWVSHRLEEILDHAERLVVLDEGRVVADDRPAALLADELLRARLSWPLLDQLDPDVPEGVDRERFRARRTVEEATRL